MRLALGPESVLKSIILKVKSQLRILSYNSSSTLTSPSPLNPTCRPSINRRLGSNSNGFMDFSRNPLSSPSSSSTTPWSLNSIVNPSNGNSGVSVTDSGADTGGSADLMGDQFLRGHLSFLDDSCFSGETEDVVEPRIPLDYSVDSGETHLHRRSFRADASFGSGNDRYGAVCKPCLYFSRGFCKHGDSGRFSHVGYSDNFDGNGIVADSPRLASQIQQHAQRDGELAFHDQPNLKVYLTFLDDSTFTVEDVATYFSHFGTVGDVRISENHMFGFVSFAHPETVTAVLARGNPHYICDSRVFVKTYKVKREVLEEKQQLLQQQIQLGCFSPGSIPSGIDPREGSKIYERSEMMSKKVEQADFVRAIEFERRRMTNLQLPNSITPSHHRSFSVGSPCYNSSASNQNPEYQFEHTGIDALEVDHASELYPYSVINQMSVIDNYLNGAEEGTDKSEMIRRKTEQAIEFERRRMTNLQLPNSITPNHHRNSSVGSPGYFLSASNQSHDYQSAHTDALEVVDDALELQPYLVINRMSVNNNYSNGAEEGTDTRSSLELALPSNLFPSASSTNYHNTDGSAKTNARNGVSSTNGNDHESPVNTNNLLQ